MPLHGPTQLSCDDVLLNQVQFHAYRTHPYDIKPFTGRHTAKDGYKLDLELVLNLVEDAALQSTFTGGVKVIANNGHLNLTYLYNYG